MTDPIAVDVPKPSFARSVPGSVPLSPLPPIPTPPAPKPVASAPPAATPLAPPPVPSTLTPAPAAPTTGTKWLGLFTKKQLTIGASAVFSLAAGIGAVRLMFPTKEEPKPAATTPQDWAAVPRTNAPEPLKPATEVPTVPVSADNLPPIPLPSMPPFPTTPVARPTGISPLPPPTIEPERPRVPPIPPPAAFEPYVPVVPVGRTEPMTPPLPALPPIPGAPMVPVVPPPTGFEPVVPPPPKVEPKITPKLPDPVIPPIPAPGGGPFVPAVPEPKLTPPMVTPDPKVEPFVPNLFPKVEPKTPVFEPPPPAFGTPTGFTKPGGTTEPKPTVPETLPRTNFDVDLYEPRANDTYESISQEFYNDKRFAAALRAFNRNQALTGVRYVEVPPMHVLRRQFAGQVGAAPTGAVPTGAPMWGAAADPVPAAARPRTTFIVPAGGMTMRAVARETLGSDLRWNDIYDLNPQFNPSSVPAGTELKLPAGARLP